MTKQIIAIGFIITCLSGCGLLEQAVDAAPTADRINAHCDLREASDPVPYCQEWRGLLKSPGSDVTPRAVCGAMSVEYIETPCPTEGIIAGCYVGELGDGSKSYWWFYPEEGIQTAADVEQRCMSKDVEFVEYTAAE